MHHALFLILVLGCVGEAPSKRTDRPGDEAATSATAPSEPTSSVEEHCNGVDDDGDGLIDDADPDVVDRTAFYVDADGDGFGDPAGVVLACEAPPGTVADSTDCDDGSSQVFPGAPLTCDAHADSDCDGLPDAPEVDDDGDGLADCDGDCDDSDREVWPGAMEVCDGRDTDCDGLVDHEDPDVEPSSCGWCPSPSGFPITPVRMETWNPCLLDPESWRLCYLDPEVRPDAHDYGRRLHRVAWREDTALRRQLFLYLPPGDGYETVTIPRVAAYAGYRTISLGYVNNVSLKTACGYEHEEPRTCYGDARHELLFGEDRSDVDDVGPADSVEGRLRTLLLHLDATYPDLGWGSYLTPSGDIRWDDVVVGGWSAGSGNTAYLASQARLDGAILFSGPQDLWETEDGEPALADWITAPRLTPGCAHWGAYHLLDSVTLLSESWDAIGIPVGEADIDLGSPPYENSQRLTSSELMEGCDAHQSMGRDGCIRTETTDAYLFALCEVAAPSTDCP